MVVAATIIKVFKASFKIFIITKIEEVNFANKTAVIERYFIEFIAKVNIIIVVVVKNSQYFIKQIGVIKINCLINFINYSTFTITYYAFIDYCFKVIGIIKFTTELINFFIIIEIIVRAKSY